MAQEDIKAKFSKIISSLPVDKKNELYSKLKSMPEEEREKAIIAIVKKHEASSSDKPINNDVNKKKSTAVQKTNQPKTVKKKKKLKKSVVKAIRFAVIGLVLIIAGLVLFFNRANLFKDKENVVETSVETSVTETTEFVPTATPTPSPSPTPTPSPTPSPIPQAEDAADLTGLVVVIDPGHQEIASEELENCADWLGTEKPRCTAGSVGVTSGMGEYELTLAYAQIVGAYLEQNGATVIYTRTENDVDISNQERAQIAVDNSADVFIRLHADAANDSLTSGVRVYVPDSGSYSGSVVNWGQELGELIAEQEGLEFDSPMATHLYTGLNYANSVPAFQISLGFMSNSDDETILLQEENMVNVAYAIADFCELFMN